MDRGGSMNAPHTRGECDWCRWPLGNEGIAWNGGVGHAECVAWVEAIVLGDDAAPSLLHVHHHLRREDPVLDFVARLGREAARLGIDRRRLAAAIMRARHAC
jgi:hypothetical protein